MGRYLSARLVYGIALLDDDEPLFGEEHESEDDYEWETLDRLEGEFPNIEIVWGGVEGYTVPVIGIKGSGFEGNDAVTSLGDAWVNAKAEIVGKNAWNVELERFCNAAGINLDRKDWEGDNLFSEPGWFLVTSYG